MMKLRTVLPTLGVLAAGCFPRTAPAPEALSANSITWGSTRWPGEAASTFDEGRAAFVANCNGCHGYPNLRLIPDERWPRIIEKMGKKSHLDAAKKTAMLHYILAFRSNR